MLLYFYFECLLFQPDLTEVSGVVIERLRLLAQEMALNAPHVPDTEPVIFDDDEEHRTTSERQTVSIQADQNV